MAIESGTVLGQYHIVSPLGAGGMGEVFRARDTRLNRDVALKVLPAHLAGDPAALARFEREAQAVAALSHPNILALHDFGSEGGVAYAVTELLEGETLRERLTSGALPPRKAIEVGVHIVRGIAAAHQKGIIHRDLKPDNIFLTRDGQVKVLDFGLAKTADAPAEQGETRLAPATEPGTVMGTVGYMSPEQVRGLRVDHRTDIFSLGAMLYEMLTGQRAFKGESHVETMNAILKEDPAEFADVAAGIPGSFERIVGRCLEKQPEERFHSAHDLGLALETVSGGSSTSTASMAAIAPAERPRRLRPALVASAVVVVGVVAYLAGVMDRAPASVPEMERLTFRGGLVTSAKLAPDGNTIFYAAAVDGVGTLEMYSTRQGSPESLKLPFGSADVVSIASSGELAIVTNRRPLTGFAAVGTLARIPLSGGAPRAVLEDVQDADWLPDGSNLVVSHFVDEQYRLEFPIGTVVYTSDGWISDPQVSPDGASVAFLDHPILGDSRGSPAIVDRAGNFRLLAGSYEHMIGLAWSSSGEEIWFTGAANGSSALQAVTPDGVLRTVLRTPGGLTLYDIRDDGAVLLGQGSVRLGIIGLAPGESKERDFSWFDFSNPIALSDDGGELLISEQGAGGGPGYSTYLRRMDGSAAVRLGRGDALALSPDGQWVLALRLDPAPAQIVMFPTGAGDERPVTNDAITHNDARFMPDGKGMLFVGSEPGHQPRSFVQDFVGGAPRPVTPEGVAGLLVSPDAAFVVADRQLYPIAGGDPQGIPGLEPDDDIVRFTTDGKALFLNRRQPSGTWQVMRLDLATGRRTPVRSIVPLPEALAAVGGLSLSGDASAYVYGYGVGAGDLYLVKNLK